MFAESGRIIDLLKAGKISELKSEHASTTDQVERLFLDAIFETDGDAAAGIFHKIWDAYPSTLLAWESLKRLEEYYYARGIYNKADSLARLLIANKPVVHSDSLPDSLSIYGGDIWVQVGAFSDFVNAARVKLKLQQAGFKTQMSEKKVEGKMLFVVRVGGFIRLEDAETAAGEIEELIQVKPQIRAGSP
jgi:hypothetical protein